MPTGCSTARITSTGRLTVPDGDRHAERDYSGIGEWDLRGQRAPSSVGRWVGGSVGRRVGRSEEPGKPQTREGWCRSGVPVPDPTDRDQRALDQGSAHGGIGQTEQGGCGNQIELMVLEARGRLGQMTAATGSASFHQ